MKGGLALSQTLQTAYTTDCRERRWLLLCAIQPPANAAGTPGLEEAPELSGFAIVDQ